MSHRNEYLAEHFNAWLDRYSPPRVMADRPEAAQKEADTLLAILGRYAPPQGYAEWLDGILRALTEGMTARTWPTGGEISKACKDASRFMARPSPAAQPQARDEAQAAAERMAEGKPVAETWLYGVGACELAARGLVDRETMLRYRSAAFLHRRDVQGEESALAWEAEAKERHEHGKALWRARDAKRQQRDLSRHLPTTSRPAA